MSVELRQILARIEDIEDVLDAYRVQLGVAENTTRAATSQMFDCLDELSRAVAALSFARDDATEARNAVDTHMQSVHANLLRCQTAYDALDRRAAKVARDHDKAHSDWTSALTRAEHHLRRCEDALTLAEKAESNARSDLADAERRLSSANSSLSHCQSQTRDQDGNSRRPNCWQEERAVDAAIQERNVAQATLERRVAELAAAKEAVARAVQIKRTCDDGLELVNDAAHDLADGSSHGTRAADFLTSGRAGLDEATVVTRDLAGLAEAVALRFEAVEQDSAAIAAARDPMASQLAQAAEGHDEMMLLLSRAMDQLEEARDDLKAVFRSGLR